MVLKTYSDIVFETCSDMRIWQELINGRIIGSININAYYSLLIMHFFLLPMLYNHYLLYGNSFTCQSKLHHTLHLSCHFLNRMILYESHTFLLLVSKFSICRSHPYSRVCINNKKVDALCVVFFYAIILTFCKRH